jgi:hypothetical protein
MPGGVGSPYPPYPQSPPRRGPDRRQLALIAGVVLAALIAIAVVVSLPSHRGARSGGGQPTGGAVAASGTAPTGAPSPATGFGVPVTDGGLRFVVAGIDCSKSQLGEGLLALHARGQFCLAQVTVSNSGDTSESLDNTAQILWDNRGERHEVDFFARLKLHENLWDTIDPGETRTGTLVFDIPRDADARELELHESSHSAGVRIPVIH